MVRVLSVLVRQSVPMVHAVGWEARRPVRLHNYALAKLRGCRREIGQRENFTVEWGILHRDGPSLSQP